MAIIAMDTFLEQLDALNVSVGNTYNAYKRTLDNITSDRHHPDHNPHGNIGQAAQATIEGMCAGEPPTATGHLEGVVEAHYSYQPRAGRPGYTPGDGEMIRTVVLKDVFIEYHLGKAVDSTRDTERAFFIDSLASSALTRQLPPLPALGLGGRTQKPQKPSWWTIAGAPVTRARDYVEELALPYGTITLAAKAGGVVEVALSAPDLPASLHKPSSLDGFGPWSRFKPDLTDCAHGWTDPVLGVQGRPELISEALTYRQIANHAISLNKRPVMVQVKVIAW